MDSDERAVSILGNHKKKLRDSVFAILGDLDSYGTSAEILSEVVEGALDEAIYDNETRVPEYYTVYHEFTDALRRTLGFQVGVDINAIMSKIESLRSEASKESGTEGRINAYADTQPKIEIDTSTLSSRFRK